MSKAIRPTNVRLKRAYDPPARSDGTRVLVDRLWPRGVRKAEAALDGWVIELAPSVELRKWFGHVPARWCEFERRYAAELAHHAEQLEQLRALARKGPLTLVFGARDEEHNDAVVLRKVLLAGNQASSKTARSQSGVARARQAGPVRRLKPQQAST